MCEQDVREGIIAKLLEELGYEKGSKNDVLRGEQLKLEYDKEIFGRPKKTDRPLESFPDYILVVDETWRWVIEAMSLAIANQCIPVTIRGMLEANID